MWAGESQGGSLQAEGAKPSLLIPAMELALVHILMVKTSHNASPDLKSENKTDSTSAKEHGDFFFFNQKMDKN